MIARGIVLVGAIVSSVSVVTASKPKKAYAASAAPATTPEKVVAELNHGAELSSGAPPDQT
jgi:hypothetical protein